MRKHSIVLAAALAVAGCQSGIDQAGSSTSSSGASSPVLESQTASGGSQEISPGPGALSPSESESARQATPAVSDPAVPAPAASSSQESEPANPSATAKPAPPGIQDASAATDRGITGNDMSASDQAITQSVTNSLMAAGIPSQTLTNLQVRTMNGRVILSGQVNTLDEKHRVEAQARQTPGVKTIISQLRIASEMNNTGLGSAGSTVGGQGSASEAPK